MELNRKNMLRILLLVFLSIVLFVCITQIEQVFAAIGVFLGILSPFITGLCLAFFFNIPMRLFEKYLFPVKKPDKAKTKKSMGLADKLRRPVSLTLSILLLLGLAALFVVLIAPQLKQTYISIIEDLPRHAQSLTQWLTDILERFHISSETLNNLQIDWDSLSKKLLEKLSEGGSSVVTTTIDITSGFLSGIVSFVMGFVFMIYLLLSKEKLHYQLKKLLYSVFPQDKITRFFEIAHLSNRIFTNFITGQCTEALILGVLCYIGTSILRIPYAITVSCIVAVTALIPVFGAFIGTAFGAIMILFAQPIKALWFILFILVLQQLESNIIYPKVVGNSVGLPGLWVLFSVTVGGSLFGAMGMLISVPCCAVLYCLLRDSTENRLRRKKVPRELYDLPQNKN